MRILLAGGGTAGHINPALAIASCVKERMPDTKILYVGSKGGMEERLVKKAGYDFRGITVSGFKRSMSPSAIKSNIITVKRVFSAERETKKIIKEFSPDICIGTGGYVSGPVIRMAQKMGIHTVIHEQNAFPGVTTKMLSKRADGVMLAVNDAKKYLSPSCKFVLTGNPVRKEILTADSLKARKKLGLDSRPVVLSFGGSLGARRVNEAMAELIARSAKDGKYQHIHAYGQYGKWILELLKEKGADVQRCDNLDIREYIDDMPDCLAASDIVVCRAGAITLSEIQLRGKPAVLIPSPNVAENHQYHNAMTLVNAKAAAIIEEKDLTPEKLMEKVDYIAGNPEILKEYSENAKKLSVSDTDERIFKVITEVVRG